MHITSKMCQFNIELRQARSITIYIYRTFFPTINVSLNRALRQTGFIHTNHYIVYSLHYTYKYSFKKKEKEKKKYSQPIYTNVTHAWIVQRRETIVK